VAFTKVTAPRMVLVFDAITFFYVDVNMMIHIISKVPPSLPYDLIHQLIKSEIRDIHNPIIRWRMNPQLTERKVPTNQRI